MDRRPDAEAVSRSPATSRRSGRCSTSPTSTRTRPGTRVSGCHARSTPSSTRRRRPTSTRSSRTCRRAGGCRSGCSNRPGCGSASSTRSMGRRRRAESRFRVRHGKTAAARRWVAVPDWLMDEVADDLPARRPHPGAACVPGFTADVAKNVMARACKAAGIVHRHPHDLRHRYASREDRRGRPGDAGCRATRALEEVPDAGHVLARPASTSELSKA